MKKQEILRIKKIRKKSHPTRSHSRDNVITTSMRRRHATSMLIGHTPLDNILLLRKEEKVKRETIDIEL